MSGGHYEKNKYLQRVNNALETFEYVMTQAEKKHGTDTWRQTTTEDHLDHAKKHIEAYQHNPTLEDLNHAMTRMMLAVEVFHTVEANPIDSVKKKWKPFKCSISLVIFLATLQICAFISIVRGYTTWALLFNTFFLLQLFFKSKDD